MRQWLTGMGSGGIAKPRLILGEVGIGKSIHLETIANDLAQQLETS
jgi:hypothetical protein